MLQAVLGNSKCLEEGLRYKFLKPWLGTGLFTSTGNHSNIGTLKHLGKKLKIAWQRKFLCRHFSYNIFQL
jgi:hypothetical protein